MEDLKDFERLTAALRPWLDQLVVVGGWAHRMHREHPLATRPPYAPVRTRDADLAFGARSKLQGQIATALKDAGFREELSSDETPPIAQYHLGVDDQGFYAEFLTPLAGSGTRRDGSADATEARAGIVAQKLRHLEVLLAAPWQLSLGGSESDHLPAPVAVRVANPVSFVAQKLLIHADRQPHKRAQDVLYIHDTIQLFGGSLRELNGVWRSQVRGSLSRTQQARIRRAARETFSVLSDTVRQAARIPEDRALRAQEVQFVCREGLAQMLSED